MALTKASIGWLADNGINISPCCMQGSIAAGVMSVRNQGKSQVYMCIKCNSTWYFLIGGKRKMLNQRNWGT